MIFVVIEQTEESIMTREELAIFLSKPEWHEAAEKAATAKWKLGDWMRFPNGWIFASRKETK